MTLCVPSVPLADALVFADLDGDVLWSLDSNSSTVWRDALVLATALWELQACKVNRCIDLGSSGIPPLVAASIRFDPERELFIGAANAQMVCGADCALLATVRRVQVKRWNVLDDVFALMPQLTSLVVLDCVGMRDAFEVAPFQSLESLVLIDTADLRDLSALASLTSLQSLDIDVCWGFTDVSPLASLAALQSLRLKSAWELEDVSPLESLKFMHTLQLLDCPGITSMPPKRWLDALTVLVHTSEDSAGSGPFDDSDEMAIDDGTALINSLFNH